MRFAGLPRWTVLILTAVLVFPGCTTLASRTSADSAQLAAAAAAAAAAQALANAAPARPQGTPAALAPGAVAARPAAVSPSPSPSAAAAAAAAAAAVAGQQRPFAEVARGAKERPGFFNLYTKEEKAWLEIRPEQFDQPFFLEINRTHGLGDREAFLSPMLRAYVVEFHRVGPLVQLIARNNRFIAKPGTPLARAVRESMSDSLIASVPIASLPDPERNSILIDANALLLADLPAGSAALEAAYHIGYTFDSRNSSFTEVHNSDELTGFAVAAHYAVAKVPSGGGAAPPSLEDARSLFLGYYYSFTRLPDPMPARLADDRIGHFVTHHWDFSDDIAAFPDLHYVSRWRLEKADPSLALSPPKKPIVFWLDRNIPDKYRASVRAGILEWNKAFERIGFQEAIRVEQQSDDADFSTADARHASVRWVVRDVVGAYAIGPRRVDPRSGEILDADIEIEDGWTHFSRRQVSEQFTPRQARSGEAEFCDYGEVAASEMAFATDLLAARGDFEPDGPEAEAYVQATLKDVVTHEVGHALGLQHNFRASTIYSQKQLSDPEFTKTHGIAGSVMDYNAVNLAMKGEPQGDYMMHGLGPYDYWAIEYAYKPIARENEKAELARIAGRSNEPELAFANDVDAGFGGSAEGMDPQVNRRDLSSDPLEYADRRFKLSRELWDRLQARQLKPGDKYEVLRRNFIAGLTQVGNASLVAAKYVGGVVYVRDHAGSGREPFTPVPAETQRAALRMITDSLFSVDSFNLRPEFVRRLTVDQFDRFSDAGSGSISPDIALGTQMLGIQRAVLDQLMNDAIANRISEGLYRQLPNEPTFKLSEMYDTLQDSIWSELKTGRDITPFRRNLQREHLKRMVSTLLKRSDAATADARALQRENAKLLLAKVTAAKSRASFSREARAHLAEVENTLEEALKAPMQRAGA